MKFHSSSSSALVLFALLSLSVSTTLPTANAIFPTIFCFPVRIPLLCPSPPPPTSSTTPPRAMSPPPPPPATSPPPPPPAIIPPLGNNSVVVVVGSLANFGVSLGLNLQQLVNITLFLVNGTGSNATLIATDVTTAAGNFVFTVVNTALEIASLAVVGILPGITQPIIATAFNILGSVPNPLTLVLSAGGFQVAV